jgi:hypothetical protein
MGSLARYACCGKEMLGEIREKMAIPESAPGVASFLPLVHPSLEMAPQLGMTHAFQSGTAQSPLGTIPKTTHIHPIRLVGVRSWAESQVPWCNAQHAGGSLGGWGPSPFRFPPHNVE